MQLVKAMKSKGSNAKGMPLYCNFPLTNRRNNLLYNVRKLWKEEKLGKFFVDYNGDITVVAPGSARKTKITSNVDKERNYVIWTMTVAGLIEQFGG